VVAIAVIGVGVVDTVAVDKVRPLIETYFRWFTRRSEDTRRIKSLKVEIEKVKGWRVGKTNERRAG
jgi:hypothetical protein